jgi:hypothetical protein
MPNHSKVAQAKYSFYKSPVLKFSQFYRYGHEILIRLLLHDAIVNGRQKSPASLMLGLGSRNLLVSI